MSHLCHRPGHKYQRQIQLEEQLYADAPPAKHVKMTSGPAASFSSSEAPVAGPSKADEKKSKMQVKKIFDQYAQFLYLIPSPI